MTSYYLNHWWFVYRRIYASISLNELTCYSDGKATCTQYTVHNINNKICRYHIIFFLWIWKYHFCNEKSLDKVCNLSPCMLLMLWCWRSASPSATGGLHYSYCISAGTNISAVNQDHLISWCIKLPSNYVWHLLLLIYEMLSMPTALIPVGIGRHGSCRYPSATKASVHQHQRVNWFYQIMFTAPLNIT